MEDEGLRLGSVSTRLLTPKALSTLWTRVVEISVGIELADGFTIESDLDITNRRSPNANPESLVEVGMRDGDSSILLSLSNNLETVKKAGPRVLSLNLYAGREWIAGISDFGDDLDVLYSPDAWAEFTRALDNLHPCPETDVEEATSRPVL